MARIGDIVFAGWGADDRAADHAVGMARDSESVVRFVTDDGYTHEACPDGAILDYDIRDVDWGDIAGMVWHGGMSPKTMTVAQACDILREAGPYDDGRPEGWLEARVAEIMGWWLDSEIGRDSEGGAP